MCTDFRVLIDLVLEEGCLEVVFLDAVIDLHPVMSNCADKHWHKHRVARDLAGVLAFEEVKGVVIAALDKFYCALSGELTGYGSRRLLH